MLREHDVIDLRRVDAVEESCPQLIVPGAYVTVHSTISWRQHKCFGTVVACRHDTETNRRFATVLWSKYEDFADMFRSFVKPLVRKNYSSLAKQIVSVQPMSVPTAGVFHIDYTFLSGSSGSV